MTCSDSAGKASDSEAPIGCPTNVMVILEVVQVSCCVRHAHSKAKQRCTGRQARGKGSDPGVQVS